MVYKMQGMPTPSNQKIKATLSRRVVSAIGVEEFLRVKLGRVGGKMIASPLSRGAGIIMSLVRADGIVRIPALKEGLESVEKVEVELLRNEQDIENTVVIIGSHDVTLDVLANEIKKTHPELNLSSAHVGSMGGIMALKRGEAHMAGIHLLDPDTGKYNISYIKRYLSEQNIVLVNLVFREQGLIVPRGNPKNIAGIEDLARDDILFINRQRGAGTRLLLDLKLKELGISPEKVKGYEREEYTHMAVAAAVAGDGADVGLGIHAAANSLDLDFIPVSPERYDLAIPEEYYKLDSIQKLLEVINESKFKQKVMTLGGYDVSIPVRQFLLNDGAIQWKTALKRNRLFENFYNRSMQFSMSILYAGKRSGTQKHEFILTFEEILQFVNAAASLGITKVRVTGGEPLVRKGVVGFIKTKLHQWYQRCFHDYQRMSFARYGKAS